MEDKSFGIVPFTVNNGIVEYLLIHQKRGHWGFPKGHAEDDENELEAALREFTEETGIEKVEIINGFRFVNVYEFNNGTENIHKTVIYFLGKVIDKNIKLQEAEVQDSCWAEYEVALDKLSFVSAKNILTNANTFIKAL